jgi:hypothetical protein
MGVDWRPKDVYNFYFSQLRIRIEMSFGLLVNKWVLHQKPLVFCIGQPQLWTKNHLEKSIS